MSAYNFASVEAWRQSGVVEQVEWLSSGDAATRETHLLADGQRVDFGETFDVGGAALAFPGDPSGPAGETINCRCTALPVVSADAPRSIAGKPWFKRGATQTNRVAALLGAHVNGNGATK